MQTVRFKIKNLDVFPTIIHGEINNNQMQYQHLLRWQGRYYDLKENRGYLSKKYGDIWLVTFCSIDNMFNTIAFYKEDIIEEGLNFNLY